MAKTYALSAIDPEKYPPKTRERGSDILAQYRSVSALARDKSKASLDRILWLMDNSDDDKVCLAAAMAVLRLGGHLTAEGDKQAQIDAAVEARVMGMVQRAREKRDGAIEVQQDPAREDQEDR